MNTREIKILAIVLILLVASLLAITLSDKPSDTSAGGLLFPSLKTRINDISQVSINNAGRSLTLTNDSGRWVLAERGGYPIDIGKLRKLLLALADARTLEEKTSNPEMYDELGVEDTTADSKGTEIRISGPDSGISLILGNLAQRKYRYVRVPGQAQSWLIDQNPTLPADAGGWLLPEILDIDSSRIQSVTITHNDGETIRIEKEDSAASNFNVPDIPDGRELSYAGVVNSIAGVLSKLNLQDVAKATETEADDSLVRAVFTTFDGLEITIDPSLRNEETWIIVSANQSDTNSDEAAKISDRVAGWEYQIRSYKGDQLRRRWDDILKAKE